MSTNNTPTADDLALLRKYDTPTICNVIELYKKRRDAEGFMDSRIVAGFPEMPPMVGYAVTVTFRSAAPPLKGNAYGGMDDILRAFADVPGPAVVVFQDLDDPAVGATFGEVMCTTFKAFGSVGLITSGAGRDLDQVRAIDFPVFTNGTIASHASCHFCDVGVPVRVGGITVYPGELLHGDLNGVTTIPKEIAASVVAECPNFVDAEAVMLNYLRSGSPTIEGFAKARNEAVAMMKAMSDRLAK